MTSHKFPDDEPVAREGFLSRWSRRKRSSASEQNTADEAPRHDLEAAPDGDDSPGAPTAEGRNAIADVTDADLPPLDTLDENSDYSVFMSSGVSAESRRVALRKLFHQPKFNIRDKLDCHVGDFTKFEPLGDTITADMRHQIERAARRKLNQAVNNTPGDDRAVCPDEESYQAHLEAARETAPRIPGEDPADHSAGSEGTGDDEKGRARS